MTESKNDNKQSAEERKTHLRTIDRRHANNSLSTASGVTTIPPSLEAERRKEHRRLKPCLLPAVAWSAHTDSETAVGNRTAGEKAINRKGGFEGREIVLLI
jgi:hypothetical protein